MTNTETIENALKGTATEWKFNEKGIEISMFTTMEDFNEKTMMRDHRRELKELFKAIEISIKNPVFTGDNGWDYVYQVDFK
jgi:hypothetical protein